MGSMLPYMGVSENSVPLNPMVNDHYPYFQTNPYSSTMDPLGMDMEGLKCP